MLGIRGRQASPFKKNHEILRAKIAVPAQNVKLKIDLNLITS